MTTVLPRVTYSNVGVDLTPVHDLLDREIPRVSETLLGRRWGNVIGDDAEDRDGRPFSVASPIDRELVVGEFIAASNTAVERAFDAASAAFPAWSLTPWQERVRILRRAAEILANRKYELAAACLIEIGKSRVEAIGEAEEVIDLIDYYTSEMERNAGYEQKLRQAIADESTRSVMKPLGVFAVISPFNFPLALSVNLLTAALVTGNAVVYKPSPNCGLTGRLIVGALREAGVPAGVVNMVAGGDEVGRALVSHPRTAGVAFTGSHAVGMSIFREIANAGLARPVVAEMGGKNPAYVTANADLAAAAEGVARSAFGLQGQKCSACSVAYIDATVRDEFVERLVAFTRNLKLGDPRERDVFMGPVYNSAAAERFMQAVARARREGNVLTGGERLAGNLFDRGYYVQPTAVELPAPGELTREELFVPFVAIRTFRNLEQALEEGNAVKYGLAAGIYTKDEAELQLFLDRAQAGVLYSNRASGATTGAWPGVQSFCGWKGSGVSHKGGLGPHFLPQFMREQSQTLKR